MPGSVFQDCTVMKIEDWGENVVLDRDLASLFQVETKVFNQAVKRNINKFEGFKFQLSDEETQQLVTICDRFKTLKHSSLNPTVFTEHGK